MIEVTENNILNRISRIIVIAIITFTIGTCLIKMHDRTKTTYNFVDLQMKYKNYIVVDKSRGMFDDEEYKLILLNPLTKEKHTVYVKYYLYHNVYFVGDTIK